MSEREIDKLIAEKLGYGAVHYSPSSISLHKPDGSIYGSSFPNPEIAWHVLCPSFCTDRNASAEIVQWFAKQGGVLLRNFDFALYDVLKPGEEDSHLLAALLATPRQIAEAALSVWGIREREAK
jgi:hypothetical protein